MVTSISVPVVVVCGIKNLLRKDQWPQTFSEKNLNDLFVINTSGDSGLFCYTSQKYLKEGKISRLAMHNGWIYTEIANIFQELTPLKERIVSPRRIFLKIVRWGQGLGFQQALVGNVVNVPVVLTTMVSTLPRPTFDSHVITLVLKKKMYLTCNSERSNKIFSTGRTI